MRTLPVALLLLAVGCTAPPAASPRTSAAAAAIPSYEPAIVLDGLYADVQQAGIFPDSKTFADATPRRQPGSIVTEWREHHRGDSPAELRAFVERNFELPHDAATNVRSDTTQSMEDHVRSLWPALTRRPDVRAPWSSLVPLPRRYVVPGGRFREVYYWDSYFTMLGLLASGRAELAHDVLDNFAWLVRNAGHVPNGNRTYYLSRSQPPFFAAMVGLYARATDTASALGWLDALEVEHAWWMRGADTVRAGEAALRVVRLADGTLLNRYWDERPAPRTESYREDEALGRPLAQAERLALYREIRATAESGWDFSSRWMRDPRDLRTLETTSLAPVDLNSILADAERTIAALRRARGGVADAAVAARYDSLATTRTAAIRRLMWDESSGWFYDLRWRTGERVTDRPTLAAASPLYFGVATPEQGRAVAARLGRDFLRPGGFVTTLVTSGQQWDAPNGWPPLQWLAIEGARRYGRGDVADSARARWLALNRRVYRATGRMMEKYDVVDTTRAAGGGEYPTQDGFGWTNGVALALSVAQGRR